MSFILLLLTLVSCKRPTPKQGSEPKYFEGFVEFVNSYPEGETKAIAALKTTYGEREVTYLGQGGFFCREYIDTDNIIIHREIYRPDSLRFYEIFDKQDTIVSTDVTRRTPGAIVTGFVKNGSFKILNHMVEAVQGKTILFNSDRERSIDIYTTYYNDTCYLLHPLVYKHAAFDCVEDMFNLSPYLTTGYRFQYGNKATVLAIATRIAPVHVPSWHFEIPRNRTILEQ